MSGRKTITYINFLQGIPAPIVALGGMIEVFLFYPLLCVFFYNIKDLKCVVVRRRHPSSVVVVVRTY